MSTALRVIIRIKLDWYGRRLVRGIQQYGQTRPNWTFLIGGLAVFGSREAHRMIGLSGADGIIVRLQRPAVEQAIKAGIPVVQLGGQRPPIDGSPSVDVDQNQVGQLAADHLLERGLRHFAFYGSVANRSERTVPELRCEAFTQQVQHAGFTCQQYMPRRVPNSSHGWDQLLTRLARWLAELPKPVGVMAASDGHGWQVLEACHRAGLAVPDEVAVIGVDNDELISPITNPPLSSVALAPERAGYEAAAMLDQLMAGKEPATPLIHIPASGVVARRSTDLLSIEDPLVNTAVRLIRDRAAEPIQVNDLLTELPLSRRSLERRFFQALGRSPLEEIRRVRLERARTLLTETTWPIPRVATASGFSSPDYFGAVFKRETGLAPLRYRKLHRSR